MALPPVSPEDPIGRSWGILVGFPEFDFLDFGRSFIILGNIHQAFVRPEISEFPPVFQPQEARGICVNAKMRAELEAASYLRLSFQELTVAPSA